MVTRFYLLAKSKRLKRSPSHRWTKWSKRIREDALHPGSRTAHRSAARVGVKRLLRRPEFVENLKYGLALGIANALSAHDSNVTAVYTFDPSTNPDSDLGDTMIDSNGTSARRRPEHVGGARSVHRFARSRADCHAQKVCLRKSSNSANLSWT